MGISGVFVATERERLGIHLARGELVDAEGATIENNGMGGDASVEAGFLSLAGSGGQLSVAGGEVTMSLGGQINGNGTGGMASVNASALALSEFLRYPRRAGEWFGKRVGGFIFLGNGSSLAVPR